MSSEPEPETAPAPSPAAAPRERLGGVLGIGIGLLMILGLFASLATKRARSLDAAELFASWFEPSELPFHLVPLEAAEQPGGERMLHLADPDAPLEVPAVHVAPRPTEVAVSSKPIEWAKIPVGEAGTPPTHGLLLTWPPSGAKSRLEGMFGSGPAMEGEGQGMGRGMPMLSAAQDPRAGLGPAGGRRVIERGRLDWGRFEAPYALERHFEPGGTLIDTLRVNLSTEREALVLFLRWPRGLPGSKERAEEFLSHLRRKGEPAQ